MSNRIEKLSDSPCYKCGCLERCGNKVGKLSSLGTIRDSVYGNKEFDYHDCGIWISLNAPEMIEVDDG